MEQEGAILALGALAQNTRLETFRLLVKSEPEGVPAGELARSIGIPQNTMSAHLSILSRANLIVSQRHSRSIIYRVNLKTFQALMMFMVQDCCGGRSALSGEFLESLLSCELPKKKLRSKKDGIVVDVA
jgi:ArsR family transcriptional regulator, arsenate/arsenite/antimonite-responsive transcriptional repressor